METIGRLIKAFLIVCIILSLLSCGQLSTKSIVKEKKTENSESNPEPKPKVPVISPAEKIFDYLEETEGLVKKSREIKQKIPECADLNNSFDWTAFVNSGDINIFTLDLRTKKPVFKKVKDICSDALAELNKIDVPKECKELHQAKIDFFDECYKHSQRGIEYIDYLDRLCSAHMELIELRDDLMNYPVSDDLNVVTMQLREIQNKLVGAKQQISYCGVPFDCTDYQSSFLTMVSVQYGFIEEVIDAIHDPIIAQSESRLIEAFDNFEARIEDADAAVILANARFDEKVFPLDRKLHDLAREVNNETDSLITEYSDEDEDIEIEKPEEFFGPSFSSESSGNQI